MSTSSNHTKAFVQCCHGKHTVASSRTLLSDHVFHLLIANIQMSTKRALHFQNDTENKYGLLETSHLHQLIEILIIHTPTSQAQHIDRRATGQWQQPTFWAGVHTTWPYATCLIQYTFTQCTTHMPYRVSLILYFSYTICFLLVWIFIHILHKYPSLQSQYAAIALTTPCTSFMQILLTNV